MKSIGHTLVGALAAAAPVFFAPSASAGGGSHGTQTTGTTPGISVLVIGLSKVLTQGISFHGTPVNIGSNVCGSLSVTTNSTCQVVADASCLAGCDPASLTLAAYNECSSECAAQPENSCKVFCSPSCKSECMADFNFDPVKACETDCQDNCALTCAQMVAQGDATSYECNLACETTCSNQCSAASSVADVDNCGVQCGASCQASCSAEVNMDCQVECQTEIFDIKSASCQKDCVASGSLFCDGQQVSVNDMTACINALVAAGIPVKND